MKDTQANAAKNLGPSADPVMAARALLAHDADIAAEPDAEAGSRAGAIRASRRSRLAGGMHAYFTGTDQHNGRLPSHHLDFRSHGGYILAPSSTISGKPYELIARPGAHGTLDWTAVTRLLEPQPQPHHPQSLAAPGLNLTHLARWVANQPEGNRNGSLFWAANRALDTNQAADLSQLAVATRQAGLADKEITRTLDSARRTSGHHTDCQAEAGEPT